MILQPFLLNSSNYWLADDGLHSSASRSTSPQVALMTHPHVVLMFGTPWGTTGGWG